MTQFVFMNHRIKQANPLAPVIVCLDADTGDVQEANRFVLRVGDTVIGHVVFDRAGLDACETHDVKAWVELNDNVNVYPEEEPGKRPVASAKKPNRPVKRG